MTDCVFCEILATGEARWVAREADAVAFAPLPGGELAPGHTLVIPRTHCLGVLDASPDELHAAIGLVQRVGWELVSEFWPSPVPTQAESARDRSAR